MPKQKEHKETVTYPPSKKKAPPFKPQRPSNLARTATTGSDKSDTATISPQVVEKTKRPVKEAQNPVQKQNAPARKRSTSAPSKKAAQSTEQVFDSEDDIEGSSDGLPDDPLTAVGSKASRQAQDHIDDALLDLLTHDDAETVREALPPDIDEEATIPQPLLLRLMHEHFDSEDTKIDKHAVVVLQKYLDVYVRETIARAVLSKKDDVEEGRASQSDSNWLDRQDLEKVAGGMLLDF